MRQRKISKEQAQQLAKDFLALLPVQDKKDLLDKLYQLGQNNPEAKEVYIKYAAPYFEEERLKKLQLMTQHIKLGNIEEAIQVAKGENIS
jgi:beta-xylosidase